VSTPVRDTPVRDTADVGTREHAGDAERVTVAAKRVGSLVLFHTLDGKPWAAGFVAGALDDWLRHDGAALGPDAIEALAARLDFSRTPDDPEEGT